MRKGNSLDGGGVSFTCLWALHFYRELYKESPLLKFLQNIFVDGNTILVYFLKKSSGTVGLAVVKYIFVDNDLIYTEWVLCSFDQINDIFQDFWPTGKHFWWYFQGQLASNLSGFVLLPRIQSHKPPFGGPSEDNFSKLNSPLQNCAFSLCWPCRP